MYSIVHFELCVSNSKLYPQDFFSSFFQVIKEFGRFPHRNKMLSRANTEEEVILLTEWCRVARTIGNIGLTRLIIQTKYAIQ